LKDEIEFLAKPYSVEQLARRVSEVLQRRPLAPTSQKAKSG
jgi:hypothetical protein